MYLQNPHVGLQSTQDATRMPGAQWPFTNGMVHLADEDHLSLQFIVGLGPRAKCGFPQVGSHYN